MPKKRERMGSMDRIKRILSVSLAMVTSLTVFNGIPLPLQNNNSTALTAFAEDSAAKTYESIYGDWIYTEIETDNNIPNTDYADQTYLTDIVCHRYCLEDVNHDGIKELIVHYGMGGTDEQFFSYCMYQNGNTVWGETLTGIYLTNDCWLSADGDGLLTVSDFGSKTDQIDRFSYGKWMPEKLGGEHPHTCPGEAAGSDPAAPSYYSYGTFNIAGLADGEKPLAYPAEMMEHCGNKLIWYEPTDRTPLRETVPSVSDDSGTCGDNLTWTFDAATGTLTISGTGSRVKTTLSDFSAIYNKIKKIVLPNTVKEIGDHAFFSFSALEIISLPDGLRSIGEEAFRWCESLTEINIPESVTQIGGNAFENTQWLNNRRSENPFVIVNSILIDGNRVQGNVTIPDGVTSIAPLAFEKSQTVTGVTIPNGVSTIGASAFKECVNLTTVVIPESLQYIADAAFAFSGLKSIAIPDSVYSIGNSAFYYCNELSSVSLPQGLMWINAYTFKGCEGLTSIELPRTLIYIDTSAFSFSGIRQIHIPCRVDHIYEDAFNYCSALTDITIENPACEIVDSPGTISNGSSSAYTIYSFTGSTAEAYANKYNRNFVALPGDGACGKDLYWDYNAATKKLTIFGTGEMDNWVGQGQLSTQSPWPRTIKSVGLPDGLTNIGSDAFFSCDPTEITLPEGLEEINWRAFGFSKIESVTLPESLIKIWPQAFSNCEQLHAITIPENVNEIGAMAFSNCKNLESITFLNPGCRIEDEKGTIFNAYEENDYVFTGTIYGYTGSTAEAYAQKYNRKFVELDDTAIVSSGACGENGDHVKWTLDEEGTLMIFGSGNIKEWKAMIAAPKYSGGAIRKASDYSLSFTGESIPWYDLRENIKKIVVNSGVTDKPWKQAI